MPAHAHTLLQISDLHLLPHPGDTMYGIDTEYYFHRVLEHALAAHPDIDLILATGDLTQEPCLDSYRRIAEKLQSAGIPCICLPGNHDDPALMQSALNRGRVSCNKQTFLGNWQTIALSSLIPGKPGGRLDEQELRFLEDCLRACPDRYALIAVHHHCLKTGSLWMDTMIIDNSGEFLAVLRRYPKVRAVTCGHIHQVMDKRTDAVRVFSAPSTCFQFEPDSLAFSLDDAGPGYRIVYLYPDGSLETAVYRLPQKPAV
ncbi:MULTISPECIES: 3',5'-cyclic-AMP phosphodiesterase [Methylomicrobium]|uniref:Putative phosphohydrolase n=1 Tax=Methylomicrobium album BG8 TaxID=686340 RepID=H8GKV0_METAL|nr:MULTISPECIES: 3',5'-cyclic-AMP phosphodiesterase [Methylomicrobium]EIC29272.1 putative phosphohydrolase [Methylomicrobium album BG8]